MTKNLYLSRLSTAASSLIRFSLVGGCVSSTCSTCTHRHRQRHTHPTQQGTQQKAQETELRQSAPFSAQHNLHAVPVLQTKEWAVSACGSYACLALHLLDALDTSPCQLHANYCPCKLRVTEPVCSRTAVHMAQLLDKHSTHHLCDVRPYLGVQLLQDCVHRPALVVRALAAPATAPSWLGRRRRRRHSRCCCVAARCLKVHADCCAQVLRCGALRKRRCQVCARRQDATHVLSQHWAAGAACRGQGTAAHWHNGLPGPGCTTRHTPEKTGGTHQQALHSGPRHTETWTARNAS